MTRAGGSVFDHGPLLERLRFDEPSRVFLPGRTHHPEATQTPPQGARRRRAKLYRLAPARVNGIAVLAVWAKLTVRVRWVCFPARSHLRAGRLRLRCREKSDAPWLVEIV
jgi:hypothetical protein